MTNEPIMQRLEFYFDVSSPWTYLAFEHALKLFDSRADLVWKPILVGGLFNTVNPSVYANRANPVAAKATYAEKDLQDWARLVGITIGSPPVFPVNSVKAMRGAFVALVPAAWYLMHVRLLPGIGQRLRTSRGTKYWRR